MPDAEGDEGRRLDPRRPAPHRGTKARRCRHRQGRALGGTVPLIVEDIREQAPGGRPFAPLSPTTLAIRKFLCFGGTKALLVHGDLRNSVTVTKDGDRVLIGVLRTARNRAGRPLVDIVALNELGSRPMVMRLTPKACAFLHAAFRKAGLDAPGAGQTSTGLAIVQIPPRPFLSPIFEKYAEPNQVSPRFLKRVAKNLGGDFGTIWSTSLMRVAIGEVMTRGAIRPTTPEQAVQNAFEMIVAVHKPPDGAPADAGLGTGASLSFLAPGWSI